VPSFLLNCRLLSVTTLHSGLRFLEFLRENYKYIGPEFNLQTVNVSPLMWVSRPL